MGGSIPTSRWRTRIDLVAAFSMCALSFILIAQWIDRMVQRSAARAAAAEAVPEVPREPMALREGAVIGDPAAPVVVVEYSDFQCPFCVRFAQDMLPRLLATYVQSGKVLWAYRHYPVEFTHRQAFRLAEAATCAERQGRFWQFHDRLFANPGDLDESSILRLGESIGLDRDVFVTCLDYGATVAVRKDIVIGNTLGVEKTPAFFVGARTQDGRVSFRHRFDGIPGEHELAAAIDEVLGVTHR